ncbi:LPXTG cell wall anchor domain-containing protein [Ligilactobacillus salivarius]|uniref:LPXTG cell wall anchor domain-containing protein n=1 Tax=Ligilactobacillus salivarius TaxID=1624 RepID=UPI00210796C9|nr:LPXTG cell wall anchor domain-containing protein [Ligilactobacillus salivarius]UTX36746.1 LPXTG cell wall anchor domain-containing protein [Ligilactobacillus salivarius]
MSMSLSASLNESLSQAQSNTGSTNTSLSNSTNGNNTVVTPTNFVSNNKVASDSLKHSVRRQTLPQTGDNTNNTGVLGGLFVLTSLALLGAKKKKD